ncbi:MAG: hypothetical protein ACTH6I_00080 [Vibrio litoralis]|uniref:hypothetical protein n=1 Tax=Vibrio litoralis TaxID=335972 RepID=UPI003F9731BA
MTKQFSRKFDMSNLPAENNLIWWKDLLARMKPAGSELTDTGLRLAIRHNYLNFYHKGQAVAKVGFNRNKELYSDLHIKYVFEQENLPQRYVRLEGDAPTIINPLNPSDVVEYQGGNTLDSWITKTRNYKGIEKTFVEDIIAANSAIIDMEMGLPISGLRMDLVALEFTPQKNAARIVFWEAKLTTDNRCRTNGPSPEVVSQLNGYRDFLSDNTRKEQVRSAYLETCKRLVDIAHLASVKVADIIQFVADESIELEVDPEPRLLICYDKNSDTKSSWARHEDKLKENNVLMQIVICDDKGERVAGESGILKTKEQLIC